MEPAPRRHTVFLLEGLFNPLGLPELLQRPCLVSCYWVTHDTKALRDHTLGPPNPDEHLSSPWQTWGIRPQNGELPGSPKVCPSRAGTKIGLSAVWRASSFSALVGKCGCMGLDPPAGKEENPGAHSTLSQPTCITKTQECFNGLKGTAGDC